MALFCCRNFCRMIQFTSWTSRMVKHCFASLLQSKNSSFFSCELKMFRLRHFSFWHRGIRMSFLSILLMNLVCQWPSFHSKIGPNSISFIKAVIFNTGVLVCCELGELWPLLLFFFVLISFGNYPGIRRLYKDDKWLCDFSSWSDGGSSWDVLVPWRNTSIFWWLWSLQDDKGHVQVVMWCLWWNKWKTEQRV